VLARHARRQVIDAARVGDVQRDGGDVARQPARLLAPGVLVARTQQRDVLPRGKAPRDGEADAAVGAADERDAARAQAVASMLRTRSG
jgi:hypothetical protein